MRLCVLEVFVCNLVCFFVFEVDRTRILTQALVFGLVCVAVADILACASVHIVLGICLRISACSSSTISDTFLESLILHTLTRLRFLGYQSLFLRADSQHKDKVQVAKWYGSSSDAPGTQ